MSRVGNKPIPVPKNVDVTVAAGNRVTVKGPKGELTDRLSPDMVISQENGEVVISRPTDLKHHREQHGLARALLNNMVMGVTEGYVRILEINGVGYRAALDGSSLSLQVGKSHPIVFQAPANVEFEVSRDGRTITIRGIDKAQLGQLAAVIRKERPPEPYKGKGIRYQGEYVRMKAGKAGKVGK